jgi:hypothetical protein
MTFRAQTFWQSAHERSRQLMTVILLQQLSVAGSQNPDAGVEEPIVREHVKVLSKTNIASALSLAQGAQQAMDFIEDLFAVRLPKFILFAVIFGFGLLLTNILPLFFEEVLMRFGAPRHYRAAWSYFLYIGVFLASLWFALAAVGIDFFGVIITLGVVSIAVSVGISGIISNIASGFTIQINDIAEIGQDIEINSVRGIVVEMNLSNVIVRLADGSNDIVFLPNSYFTQYPVRRHNQQENVGSSQTNEMMADSGTSASRLEALVVAQNGKSKHS